MAQEIKDLLGRISSASDNIGKNIEAMLSGGVTVIETPTPGPDADKLSNLAKTMEELDKNFASYMKDDEQRVDDVIGVLEDIRDQAKKSKKDSEKLSNADKNIGGLEKTITKGLNDATRKIVGAINSAQKELGKPGGVGTGGIGDAGGGGGRGGGGGGRFGGRPMPIPPNDDKAIAASAQRAQAVWFDNFKKDSKKQWAAWFAGISTALTGGSDPWQIVFHGAVEDTTMWRKEMRKVAFQTQGITGDMRDMQAGVTDFGKAVAQTGQPLEKMQQSYLKNLKKGVKSLEQTQKVLKSGLNTATMIGADAEQTADLFHDWHMTMGLNANQMAQVGRNVQEVGRRTGVVGDELLDVVRSTEKLIKNMKNAGVLTANAVKQFTLMSAEARKLGIGDTMDDFLGALSSGTNLLMEADEKTRDLAMIVGSAAGKMAEVMNGTIMQTREGARALAEGLEQTIQNFAGRSMEELKELEARAQAGDQMAADTLRDINLALKDSTGRTLKELSLMMDTASMAGKGLADQMKDYQTQLDNTNLTAAEATKIEKDRQNALMSTGFEFMTAFDKQASQAGVSFEQAAERAASNFNEDQLADLNVLAKDMGMSMTTATDKWMVAGLATAKQLKEAGGKDFTADIQKAMSGGDIAKTRELLSQMNVEQQKLGVAQAKGVDPIEQMAQDVNEINEYARQMADGIVGGFIDLIGSTGLMAAQIGAMAATLWAAFGGGGGIFGKMLGKIVGGGKDGGGNAAAGGILGKAKDWLFGSKKEGGSGAEPAQIATTAAPKAAKKGAADACSVTEMVQNVKVPEFDAKAMQKAGRNLAKGAAALTILIVGVMALAVVILTLGRALMAVAGLDAKTAIEIGLTVGAVIGAAAMIAGMAILAAEGLKKIADLEKHIAEITKGAVILLALTPAMMLLSLAILGMGALLTMLVSPQTAVQIAAATAAVMAAAGAISLAVLISSAALMGLGVLASGLGWWAAGMMLIGAAVLLALTPAIMGLAAAIIGMGAILTSIVDPAWAASVAMMTAKVLLSAGMIAAAVLMGSAALAGLAALVGFAPIFLLAVGAGAGALMTLAPAIMALATAIIYMGAAFTAMVDPAWAAQIATAVAKVMLSAAAITASILSMAALMAGIGALAVLAPVLFGLMWAGAGAFMILAPAIMALTAAIVYMAAAFTAVVDPAWAASVAEGLQTVMDAAWGITWSILGWMPLMAGLGMLIAFAPSLVPLIWAGSAALFILAAPVMALALGIMAMGAGINALFPAEYAEEIQNSLDAVFGVASTVAWAVVKWGPVLAILGAFTLAAAWIAGAMMAGVVAFAMLTAPIVAFSATVMWIGRQIAGLVKPEEAEEIGTALENMGKVAKALATSTEVLQENIVPLTQGGWFSDSPIEQLQEAMPMFKSFFTEVARFFRWGIIKPIEQYFGGLDLGSTTNTIQALGSMAKALKPTMKFLDDVVAEWTDTSWWSGSSKVEELSANMPEFRKFFLSVAKFFRHGIITPVLQYFGDVDQIKVATAAIEGIGTMASKIPSVLEFLSGPVDELTTAGWWSGESPADKLGEKMPLFREFFVSVAKFMRHGIVTPILQYFPEKGTIEEAAARVDGMVVVIKSLTPFLDDLTAELQPLITGGWFSDSPIENAGDIVKEFAHYFWGIGMALKYGIMHPIMTGFPTPEEADQAIDRLIGMKTVIKAIPSTLAAITSTLEPLVNGPWWSSPVADMEDMISEFAYFFSGIGRALGWGVFLPIMAYFPNEKRAVEALSRLKAMENVIKAVPPVLDAVSSELLRFTNGWWWFSPIADMRSSAREFGHFFWGISQALQNGIIDPVLKNFADVAALEEAANKLELLADIMTNLVTVMQALSEVSKEMQETDLADMDPAKLEKIGKAVMQLQGAFMMGRAGEAGKMSTDRQVALEGEQLAEEGMEEGKSWNQKLYELFATQKTTRGETTKLSIPLPREGVGPRSAFGTQKAADAYLAQQHAKGQGAFPGVPAAGRATTTAQGGTGGNATASIGGMSMESFWMDLFFGPQGPVASVSKEINSKNGVFRSITTAWGKELTMGYISAQKDMFTGEQAQKAEREAMAAKDIGTASQKRMLISLYDEGANKIGENAANAAVESKKKIDDDMVVANQNARSSVSSIWSGIFGTIDEHNKQAEEAKKKGGGGGGAFGSLSETICKCIKTLKEDLIRTTGGNVVGSGGGAGASASATVQAAAEAAVNATKDTDEIKKMTEAMEESTKATEKNTEKTEIKTAAHAVSASGEDALRELNKKGLGANATGVKDVEITDDMIPATKENLAKGAERWTGAAAPAQNDQRGLKAIAAENDPASAASDKAFREKEAQEQAHSRAYFDKLNARGRGGQKPSASGSAAGGITHNDAANKILSKELDRRAAEGGYSKAFEEKVDNYFTQLREEAEAGDMAGRTAKTVVRAYGENYKDITSLIREKGNALGGVGIANSPSAFIAGERGKERISIEKLGPGGLTELEAKTAEMIESSTLSALNSTSAFMKHAVPTAAGEPGEGGEDGVSQVQPVHLRDITETMMRDRASTEAGAGSRKSDELSRIDEASQRQVDELVEIREGIQELVAIFKQSDPVGSPAQEIGSGRVNRRPRHAASYGELKYGRPEGTANRQVINDGN